MSDDQFSTARILVIDDDASLLFLLKTMLNRIGMTPVTALNATEGLVHLNAEPFDLLILDLMLPDISGFDLLQQLRADSKFDTMPVLILSAMVDTSDISKGLELGADGYLTKPYLSNTLTNRVRSLLTQGRLKQE